MITETGRVVAVENNGIWVETLKQSACASCAAKSGCGQKLLGERFPGANMTFVKAFFHDSNQDGRWQVGDEALFGIEESALVKGALLVYIVPIITMFLGAYIFMQLTGSDTYTALGALIGLAFGGVGISIFNRNIKYQRTYQPVVISKMISAIQ